MLISFYRLNSFWDLLALLVKLQLNIQIIIQIEAPYNNLENLFKLKFKHFVLILQMAFFSIALHDHR